MIFLVFRGCVLVAKSPGWYAYVREIELETAYEATGLPWQKPKVDGMTSSSLTTENTFIGLDQSFELNNSITLLS